MDLFGVRVEGVSEGHDSAGSRGGFRCGGGGEGDSGRQSNRGGCRADDGGERTTGTEYVGTLRARHQRNVNSSSVTQLSSLLHDEVTAGPHLGIHHLMVDEGVGSGPGETGVSVAALRGGKIECLRSAGVAVTVVEDQ